MDSISVIDLSKINNPIIIDIRNNYYYNMGHIDGAINIPYYNLLNNYNHYLDKNNTYYIYCDKGDQSLEIAKRLSSFGYHMFNIIGGYQEYLRVFSYKEL